ncbi:NAD(+) synthase [Clostridium sp. Cult1]|nr:NAD(+) synthase [Clostridium sp. Cult1]
MEKICNDIIEWLRNKAIEAGGEGLVFGLSGGIDSAVVAALSKKAFPNNSLGIIMPCHSNPLDEEHGLLVAESLGLTTKKVELSKVYDEFIESFDFKSVNKLAMANIKPRLRMTTLYYFAQNYNYLVIGSSNKSEFTIGYFTKHGDSGVDLLPLASFVKKDIWDMAKYLNIPKEIIEKPPTAGLWENQTDEDEMGFGYDILDNYIINKTGPKNLVERIKKMNNNSEHKRNFPPIYIPKNK